MRRFLFFAATIALLPSLGSAQGFNVDFGGAAAPSASYAAVGAAGAWNLVGVLPPGQRAPLVGLDGGAVDAKIYMIGGTSLLAFNNPATSGDDEALMDDMLIGFNNPVDVCVWVEDLELGDYDIVLYAMTPNDDDWMCRTRVDFATPGPVDVGGAWPGAHESKVTYSRFTVSVTDGTIGLHSGLWAAGIQSGLNGIQLLPHAAMGAALVPPTREGLALRGISPSPFTTRTSLRFDLEREARVTVSIWDVAGRRVRTLLERDLGTGSHDVPWDGRDGEGRFVPAGVYFCRVAAGDESAHGRVTLTR